jgi:hypothetical protein
MSPGNDPSSDDLPRFEKLKFYTDLYKFYCELPFKVCAGYSVASTLLLAVTANLTKNLRVTCWVAFLIVVIELFIGRQLYVIDHKYIEPHKAEIESLVKELGLSFGPNFHVMRFVLRLSIISLLLLPFGVAMVMFYFATR